MGRILKLDANGDLVWIDEDTGTVSGNLFGNDVITEGYRLVGIEALDIDGHSTLYDFLNDSDGNDETITLDGRHGRLVVDKLGNYTYFLDNASVQYLSIGTFTNDTFKYFVTDNTGRKDSANLTIRIEGSNDAPVASDDHNKVILVEDADRDTVTGNVISGKGNEKNMGVDIDPDGNYHFWDGENERDHRDDFDDDYDERGILSRLRVTDVQSLNLQDSVHQDADFISGPGNHSITIQGMYGVLVMHDNGKYIYHRDDTLAAVQAISQGEIAQDVFKYTITDSQGGFGSATLTIDIMGTNDAPVAVMDDIIINEDAALIAIGNVLLNDLDVDTHDVLSVISNEERTVNVMVHGVNEGASIDLTYSIAPDGSIILTPAGKEMLNTLAPGDFVTFDVAYTMWDGLVSSSSVATVKITGENDAPISAIMSDGAALEDDSQILIDVNALLISVNEPEVGDAHFISGVSTLSGIDFSYDASTGILNITPGQFEWLAEGVTHNVVFTSVIEDGNGGALLKDFNVVITGQNDAPVAVSQQFDIKEGSSLAVSATDIDGDTLTFTTIQAPEHGSLDSNGIYTPDAGYLGEDRFSFQVSDGLLTSNEAYVYVFVDWVDDYPTIIEGTKSAGFTDDGGAKLVEGQLTATDADVRGADQAAFIPETIYFAYGHAFFGDPSLAEGSFTIDSSGHWTVEFFEAHHRVPYESVQNIVFTVTTVGGVESEVSVDISGQKVADLVAAGLAEETPAWSEESFGKNPDGTFALGGGFISKNGYDFILGVNEPDVNAITAPVIIRGGDGDIGSPFTYNVYFPGAAAPITIDPSNVDLIAAIDARYIGVSAPVFDHVLFEPVGTALADFIAANGGTVVTHDEFTTNSQSDLIQVISFGDGFANAPGENFTLTIGEGDTSDYIIKLGSNVAFDKGILNLNFNGSGHVTLIAEGDDVGAKLGQLVLDGSQSGGAIDLVIKGENFGADDGIIGALTQGDDYVVISNVTGANYFRITALGGADIFDTGGTSTRNISIGGDVGNNIAFVGTSSGNISKSTEISGGIPGLSPSSTVDYSNSQYAMLFDQTTYFRDLPPIVPAGVTSEFLYLSPLGTNWDDVFYLQWSAYSFRNGDSAPIIDGRKVFLNFKVMDNLSVYSNVVGSKLDDVFIGNKLGFGVNFHGNDGDDFIFGGTGADHLYGGKGSDFFYIDTFAGKYLDGADTGLLDGVHPLPDEDYLSIKDTVGVKLGVNVLHMSYIDLSGASGQTLAVSGDYKFQQAAHLSRKYFDNDRNEYVYHYEMTINLGNDKGNHLVIEQGVIFDESKNAYVGNIEQGFIFDEYKNAYVLNNDNHVYTVNVLGNGDITYSHRGTDIYLNNNHFFENNAPGAVVGILLTQDVDVGQTYIYELLGTGYDNSLFTIDGNKLILKQSADYETKDSYTIALVSRGSDNLDISNLMNVWVDNINDAPSGADKTLLVPFSTNSHLTTGDFGFSDADGNAFVAVKITSLSSAGVLALNGKAVSVGDEIAASDIPKLSLVPVDLSSVPGNQLVIGFKVKDAGGTANGGIDTDPVANTLTLNYHSVTSAIIDQDKQFLTADGKLLLSAGVFNAQTIAADVSKGLYGSLTVSADGTWTYTADHKLAQVMALGANRTSHTDVFEVHAQVPGYYSIKFMDYNAYLAADKSHMTEPVILKVKDFYGNYGYTSVIDPSHYPGYLDPTVRLLFPAGVLASHAFKGEIVNVTPTDPIGQYISQYYPSVQSSYTDKVYVTIDGTNDPAPVANNSDIVTQEHGFIFNLISLNDPLFYSSYVHDSGNLVYDLSPYDTIDHISIDVPDNPVLTYQLTTSDGNPSLSVTSPYLGAINKGLNLDFYHSGFEKVTINYTNSDGATVSSFREFYGIGIDAYMTVTEDTVYNLNTAHEFDAPVNYFLYIKSLPTKGILQKETVNLKVGDAVLISDLDKVIYIPFANAEGADTFTVQDPFMPLATVHINIIPVNDAPIAHDDSFGDTEATIITPLQTKNINVLANDTDVDIGHKLKIDSVEILDGKAGAAIIVNEGGVDKIQFNPTGGDVNAYNYLASGATEVVQVQYTMSDEHDVQSTAVVNITITGINDAPTGSATALLGDVPEDSSFTVSTATLIEGIADVDVSDVLSIANLIVDNAEVVDNLDGTFTITPILNFSGTVNLTYDVIDGHGGSISATNSFEVTSVNDAPVAVDNRLGLELGFVVAEDTLLTIDPSGVLGNDWDVEGDVITPHLYFGDMPVDLDLSITTINGGTVQMRADGGFTYKPSLDFNGIDSFQYILDDGQSLSNVATVEIQVNAANDAPVGVVDSYNALEDRKLSVDKLNGVLANDTDADNDILTAVLVSGPTHGTINLNGDGSFVYTPNDPNFVGEDSFTYQAKDGSLVVSGAADNSLSEVTTVTITVNPVNDAPTGTDHDVGNPLVIQEDEAHVFTLADFGFSDPDDDPANAFMGVTIKLLGGSGVLSLAEGVDNIPRAFIIKDYEYVTADQISSGKLVFTPLQDQNSNTVNGIYAHFNFYVQDDGGTANGGVDTGSMNKMVIDVAPVNDAPTGSPTTLISGLEDVPYDVTVADLIAGFTDVEGDDLSVINLTVDQGCTVVDGGDTFTIIPPANFFGVVTLEYDVEDGNGGLIHAINSIDFASVNDAPVAEDANFTIDEGGYIPSAQLVASDVEGSLLSFALVDPAPEGLLFHVDGTFSFVPVDNFYGEVIFKYVAKDMQSSSNEATVTITVNSVNDAPVGYATALLEEGSEDIAYTVSASDLLVGFSDVEGDALSVIDLVADNGCTVVDNGVNTDGVHTFTITPPDNFNGEVILTYKVEDGLGAFVSGANTFILAPVNDAPALTGSPTATLSGSEDTPYTVTDSALLAGFSDVEGDTLSVSGLSADNGCDVAYDADSDSYTITPPANFFGTVTLEYTVSDGNGGVTPASIDINFAAVNDAPVAQGDDITIDEDGSIPLTQLVATDVEGDTLTYSIVSLYGIVPEELVLNSDGTFTYKPTANFNGDVSFQYKVNDGTIDSAAATVNIHITAVNDAPALTGSPTTLISGLEDVPYDVTVADLIAGFTDVEGDALSVIDLVADNGCTVVDNGVNTDGVHTFTITPPDNFNGEVILTYKVEDGNGGSTPASIDINFAAVNDEPVAEDANFTINEDGNIPLTQLVATDVDGDTLTYSIVGLAPSGLVFNSDGTFTYTPAANFNGDVSFQYKVNDGTIDSVLPATVTIHITPVNDAPTGSPTATLPNGIEDTPYPNINFSDLLAGFSDVEGDALSVIGLSADRGCEVVDNDDGTFTIITPANLNGKVTLNYTVSDGNGGETPASIDINFTPVNDAPTGISKTITINEDTTHIFSAADFGFSDIDGNSLSTVIFSGYSGPSGVNLKLASSSSLIGGAVIGLTDGGDEIPISSIIDRMYFTPAANAYGDNYATFDFQLRDNGGTANGGVDTSVKYTITINVNPVNDAPVVTIPTGLTIDQDTSLAPTQLVATDADGDPLTYSIQSVTHGTATIDANGLYTYTPDTGFSGTGSINISVSDGTDTTTVPVLITISAGGGGGVFYQVVPWFTDGNDYVEYDTEVVYHLADSGALNSYADLGGRNPDDDGLYNAGPGNDEIWLPYAGLFSDYGYDESKMFKGGTGDDLFWSYDSNDLNLMGGNGADRFNLGGSSGVNTIYYDRPDDATISGYDEINYFDQSKDKIAFTAASGVTSFQGVISANETVLAHSVALFYSASYSTRLYANPTDNPIAAPTGSSLGSGTDNGLMLINVTYTTLTNPLLFIFGTAPAGVSGSPINLALSAPIENTDIMVKISDMPAGWSLDGGVHNTDGTWSIMTNDPSKLTVTTPDDFVGAMTLQVNMDWTNPDGSAGSQYSMDNVEVFAPNSPIFALTTDDNLTGSAAADMFVFEKAMGDNVINNFDSNGDHINLVGFDGINSFDDLNISGDANNSLITIGDGQTISLIDVDISTIDAGDFLFNQLTNTVNDGLIEIGQYSIMPFNGILENNGIIHSAGRLVINGDLTGLGNILLSDSGSLDIGGDFNQNINLTSDANAAITLGMDSNVNATIHGFNGDDILNLSALLTASDKTSLLDSISLIQSNDGTTISVHHIDAPEMVIASVTLSGVTNVTLQDMLDNHQILAD